MQQISTWQQQRDENIAQKLAHMESVAQERFENAQKTPRALVREEVRTPAQLDLFNLNAADYDYIEQRLKQLPRQGQREHFRRLYINAYQAVRDDGSIAFKFGNKQRRHANRYLSELLDVRLDKVFAQYHIDFDFLHRFIAHPQIGVAFELELQQNLLERAAFHFDTQAKAQAKRVKLPFYSLSESKLKRLAHQLADSFAAYQLDYVSNITQQSGALAPDEINACIFQLYKDCGKFANAIGFPLTYWQKIENDRTPTTEQIDIALRKVTCEKHWFKRMRTLQKRMVEHIAIACGEVCKQRGGYISKSAFGEWSSKQKENICYLQAMILVNVDNPEEQAELFDTFLKSSANPALRRNEMMVRLRGIEEWAEENGNEALFLTLTAPSSYHAVSSKTGNSRKQWNGASPRDTQAYLNKLWAQFRAQLAKRGIKIYGMRVAEPHHDATPHWHLLTYVKAEHKAEVIRLFKQKALEIDGDEKGAQEHRCKVDECDKAKGSATAYIAKYISKNIDGFAAKGEVSDENPELNLQQNANRVRAWASYWGIRQFQFYGGASISVWRELRRLLKGQADDEIIQKAQAAADVGCYATYFDIQGGAEAKRADQPIRLDYEEKAPNKYGEKRKAIIGLANRFSLKNVKSRLKKWEIRRKPVTERSEGAQDSAPRAPWTWTCVSNCNRSKLKQQINKAIEADFLPLTEHKFDYLLRYGRITLDKYTALELKGDDFNLVKRNQSMVIHTEPTPRYIQKLKNLRKQ